MTENELDGVFIIFRRFKKNYRKENEISPQQAAGNLTQERLSCRYISILGTYRAILYNSKIIEIFDDKYLIS